MFKFTKKELKIFLTVFILSSVFIHWSGWNENSRLDLTRAILEQGRLEIDNYANNTSDRAFYNNHYYIEKSPSSSWLITPVYASWRFIYYNFFNKYSVENIPLEYQTIKFNNGNIIEPIHLSLFIKISQILITLSYSVLFTSLTTMLIYKFSSFFLKIEWQKLFVTFAYWLGTIALFYSLILYNHAFPAFLVFLSFYILFTSKNKKNISIFISGILLGLAIITEAAIMCFFIPFLLYVAYLTGKSRVLLFLIYVTLGMLPLLLYNYLIFDNPLKLTFEYIDPVIWGGSGLGGNSLGFNSLPNSYVFLRLLIYPEKGLFFYCPILILSIFGFYFMFKEYRVECLLILSMFILILVFISSYKSWWEYTSFGPRRIFTIIPFLIIPIIFSVKKIRFSLILILFFVSFFINIVSLNLNIGASVDVFILPYSFKVNPLILEKVNSFKIIDNPLYSHIINFFESGPRSILIKSFLVKNRIFDIRDVWPSTNLIEETKILNLRLFTTSFGPVLMKLSLITTLVVFALIFLIWRKSAINFILHYKILFIIVFLIFLFYFFTMKDFYRKIFFINWYPEEKDQTGEFRWMGNESNITYYAHDTTMANLTFTAMSYYNPRNLDIYVNNKFVERLLINTSWNKEKIKFNPNQDENMIRFNSVGGCDVPEEIEGTNDTRCLSFAFRDIKIE